MYLYAIGLIEDLVEPYNNCYIGVTSNLENRWNQHLKSKYKVGEFIRENSLNKESNMKIIFSGDESDCFELEESLRPSWNVGLNIAPGGRGGKVCEKYESGFSYSKEEYVKRYSKNRSEKISTSLTNRKKTLSHKKAISKTRSLSKATVGKNNGKAKKWLLTSPDGVIYYIHGNLDQECKNMNLLITALKRYKGMPVPIPNYNGFGGYRPKSDASKLLRENTSGWILKEIIE
jgi:hypothetical protein